MLRRAAAPLPSDLALHVASALSWVVKVHKMAGMRDAPSALENVESTFDALYSVIKASARPLPKATGDGTYVESPSHATLLQDLASLRIDDLRTAGDVARTATTSNPVDDRTYLMERVIKVVPSFDSHRN